MNTEIRFKRGDCHPCVHGVVFLHYQRGLPRWGSHERLSELRETQNQQSYKWGRENPDKRRISGRRMWRKHRDRRCAELRIYGAKRRAALKAAGPEALAAYYAKYKDKANASLRQRTATDSLFRFKKNLTRRIGAAFNYHSATKLLSTHALLGCSIQEARKHIESLFLPGMTWSNHRRGGWHVDHKIPLASAKTEADLIALCHYTNLQPLWEPDNIRKGAKILPVHLS